jgi:hypothetical protein
MEKSDQYFLVFSAVWALVYLFLPYTDLFAKSPTFLTYNFLVILTVIYIVVFVFYANKYVERVKS